MSETITCPTCQQSTPTEYNFCLHCSSQTKCLNPNCGKVLVTGKAFCLVCSQPVQATATQPSRNKYKRVVKPGKYGAAEETDFDFTDHAATELAAAISSMMMGRLPQQAPFQARANQVPMPVPLPALIENVPEQEPDNAEPKEETAQAPPANADAQGAARFFTRSGDYLVKEVWDYKGKTWADQQRRFILLYTAAYCAIFNKYVPSKDHYKVAAEKAKIYDKVNFNRYLEKMIGKELTEIENTYKSSINGEGAVSRYVAEMNNEQVLEGHAYTNQLSGGTAPKYRPSEKDKERFREWAKEDVDLGQLDILNIETGRDYALLAFWLLITRLTKGESFRWNEAYEYLTARSTAVSASAAAFSKAVKSPTNSEFFRESGEAYFLTPEANVKVQSWVDGTSKPGPDTTKAK